LKEGGILSTETVMGAGKNGHRKAGCVHGKGAGEGGKFVGHMRAFWIGLFFTFVVRCGVV